MFAGHEIARDIARGRAKNIAPMRARRRYELRRAVRNTFAALVPRESAEKGLVTIILPSTHAEANAC
jgi:hypothetical protein